jgi:hypothetical protein
MESTNYFQNGIKELTNEDLFLVNGGSFAYDFGFFLRELVIWATNGGNGPGNVAVGVDIGLNYKPVH